MQSGQRIDGSACVFGRSRRAQRREFMPPFVKASFEASERGLPYSEALSHAEFELLSLAARAELLGFTRPAGAEGQFPVLQATDLLEVINEAATFLDLASQGDPPKLSGQSASLADVARARRHLSAGVQIVGCRIVASEDDVAAFRLTNLRLPFSVRLIGCVVDAPIVAPSCRLVTLDLSGSAIRGLDATFLETSGSVRLRRTMAVAPLDFAGSRIRGYFDGADLVIQTLHRLPRYHSFAAGRGALNLSQSTIENELHLERAQIWGGLALKGAVVSRSIFMEDAIIRSPAGVIEKLEVDACSPALLTAASRDKGNEARFAADAERRRARLIVELAPQQPSDPDIWRHLEAAECDQKVEESSTLEVLLSDVRSSTAAIRADGVDVAGSIFARGLVAIGRVRIKYASIKGGLHLEGALLRAAAASDATIAIIEAHDGELAQRHAAANAIGLLIERPEKNEIALDVRDTKIAGNLNLSRRDNARTRKASEQVAAGHDARAISHPETAVPVGHTALVGAVTATGVEVAGKVDFASVHFSDPGHNGSAFQSLDLSGCLIGDDVRLLESFGLKGADFSYCLVEGSIFFADPLEALRAADRVQPSAGTFDPYRYATRCSRRASEVTGEICLRGAQVKGDVHLIFSPEAGPDLAAELLRVGGKLEIARAADVGGDIVTYGPHEYDVAKKLARQTRRRLERDAKSMDDSQWAGRKGPAKINLRDARATVFSHPPSAWPQQDGLIVAGFVYERSADVGPLAPFGFTRQTGKPNPLKVAGGFAAFVFGIGIAILSFLAPDRPILGLVPADLGVWNVRLLAAICGGIGARTLAAQLFPRMHHARPMALKYLIRQRVQKNRYRMPGKIFAPLGPYRQAARALQEEGRPISANFVEAERLDQRTHMLSWRHHLLAKGGLLLVKVVAFYGFSLTRAVTLMAVLIVSTAMVAEHAYRERMLEPAAQSRATHKPFVALAYATDVVIPLIDNGEKASWQPIGYGQGNAEGGQDRARPSYMNVWFWLAKVFGWGLSTVVAASLAMRAESVFARIQE